GECSGLFNQLPDVVTNNRDALFEFKERKRTTLAHDVFPGQYLTTEPAGTAAFIRSYSFDLNVRRMDDLPPFSRIHKQRCRNSAVAGDRYEVLLRIVVNRSGFAGGSNS